jgi:hypothetical protein
MDHTTLTDVLLGLERRGWDSLCDGTGDRVYGELMTEDGLMVLANGATLDRSQVLASLAEAPPWDGYAIDDEHLVPAGPDAAALVYRGTARREGAADFVGVMTSLYTREGDGWRLALYTQTVVPTEGG